MADIQYRTFGEVDLNDPFFDSLREDYQKFDDWFQKKSLQDEKAHIYYGDDQRLCCFLYLKEEDLIDDEAIVPHLPAGRWLKVGTFKVDAHRTKLGERMVKRIFDFAIQKGIFKIYTTVFSKHEPLIRLLKRYGFHKHGEKGGEMVLIKIIATKKEELSGDACYDFPSVLSNGTRKFILGIYPKFHTALFSDSKLKTEEESVLKDCTPSNSIHKIYITNMRGVEVLKRGDILIIYRTKDQGAKNAHYSSVATSICVVEEYKDMGDFQNQDSFLQYCKKHTIFSREELIEFYFTKKYRKIIKMTYNVSFKKKVLLETLRKILASQPNSEPYWGFFELSNTNFEEILKEAKVDESIIIN